MTKEVEYVNWKIICTPDWLLVFGQKKLTCRMGANDRFSNRFGCKGGKPNGEPENPPTAGSVAWLSSIYACCQDGMAGTSPMGRCDDDMRGHNPVTWCRNNPCLSKPYLDFINNITWKVWLMQYMNVVVPVNGNRKVVSLCHKRGKCNICQVLSHTN